MAAILAGLTVIVLVGCSASSHQSGNKDDLSISPAPAMTLGVVALKPLPQGAMVPTFTGPWAEEFRFAYLNSQSDLQRDVLTDGTVSDQEMSALRDAFASCAEQSGLSKVKFSVDGGMSLDVGKGMSDGEVDAVVAECGKPTISGTDILYNGMRLNPSNDDVATTMAECLVSVGLAPKGYSRQDYLRDSPDDSYPFDSNSDAFRACVQDPLGAMK